MTYFPGVGGISHLISSSTKFFKERKALSEDTAIPMTNLDWTEIGFLSDPTAIRFNTVYKSFIKKTSSGKYWFDPGGAKNWGNSWHNNWVGLLVGAFLGWGIAMLIILPLIFILGYFH